MAGAGAGKGPIYKREVAERFGWPQSTSGNALAELCRAGLIERRQDRAADDRQITIDMTLTAPGCPVAGEMPGWVENAVGAVPGVVDGAVGLARLGAGAGGDGGGADDGGQVALGALDGVAADGAPGGAGERGVVVPGELVEDVGRHDGAEDGLGAPAGGRRGRLCGRHGAIVAVRDRAVTIRDRDG